MPLHHPIIVGTLVGAAVVLAIICCVGLMVMSDAFQRLNFSAAVVTFSTLLIAIAVWIEDKDPQARIKVVLIGLALFLMNSVLTAATAKALRIQQQGYWSPRPEEGIQVMGRDEVAGAHGSIEDHEA